jgi:SSS family solute:Na+ symporter
VKLGGIGAWWPSSWAPTWDSQPFFSFDPHVRLTVFGSLLAYVLWWIFTAGSDQMAIQRYLATRDARAARRAFLINSLAETLVTLVLALLGFALLAFYHKAGASGTPRDADQYFSQFIIAWLPAGLSGLVISGLLASAMGSLSSGINSSATVLVVDFLRRLRPGQSAADEVRLSRRMTLFVGGVAVGLSLLMGKVSGNLIEVTSKTNGLFLPSLFSLFFMALFVPFATPLGAAAGSLVGLLAAFAVAYWEVITGGRPISFQWIYPVSIVINLAVGCLVSLITPRRAEPSAAAAVERAGHEPLTAASS